MDSDLSGLSRGGAVMSWGCLGLCVGVAVVTVLLLSVWSWWRDCEAMVNGSMGRRDIG